MFKSVYETTPCTAYNLHAIKQGLQEAMARHELGNAVSIVRDKEFDLFDLKTVKNSSKEVPVFSHPITVPLLGSKESIVCLDTRPFTRTTGMGEVVVTNLIEYRFMALRGLLQLRWNDNNNAQDLVNLGSLQITAFARWISEAVSRRLGLTPLEQMQVMSLSGYYYLNQFVDARTLHDDEKLKMATQAARATNVPVDKLLEMTDQLEGTIHSISDFISALRQLVQSPRLDALTVAFMYGAMGGGWFGANAREIVAVALEHPPTFIAMVYTAVTDRTYHRCFLADLIARVDRRGELGKQFVNNLTAYLETSGYV